MPEGCFIDDEHDDTEEIAKWIGALYECGKVGKNLYDDLLIIHRVEGDGILQHNELAKFIECDRCCEQIPESELLESAYNGQYCSYCDHMLSKCEDG